MEPVEPPSFAKPEHIAQKILSRLGEEDCLIVGIDGPTARGKTMMANKNGEIVGNSDPSIRVQYFRLDWLLKQRRERLTDLSRLATMGKCLQLE